MVAVLPARKYFTKYFLYPEIVHVADWRFLFKIIGEFIDFFCYFVNFVIDEQFVF